MKSPFADRRYVPGSSRAPRSNATLLLQMAKAAEEQAGVAARIRELRGRKPQPAIAEQVGVTLRAYQAWEAGGGVSWDNLRKLAELHDVSEEYILYGPEDERPPQTQMDRIEAKLDTILEHLGLSDPAEGFERELAEAAQPSASRGASTARGGRVRSQVGR